MATLPNLPVGWVWHCLQDTEGRFEIAVGTGDNRTVVGAVSGGVWLPVPVLRDAWRDAFAKEAKVTIDGKTYKGQEAALIKKYLHGAESIRGKARVALEKAEDADQRKAVLQDMIADYQVYGGPSGNRGSFRKVAVSKATLAEIMADETLDEAERLAALEALLQNAGATVS